MVAGVYIIDDCDLQQSDYERILSYKHNFIFKMHVISDRTRILTINKEPCNNLTAPKRRYKN